MSVTNRDYTKTWIPGSSRGTQTFNSPSTLNIPYGRYKGTVSGRGGSGNVPVASAWVSNYNTNYNTIYPIANQPATAWVSNYNTNYNVVYPIANQPATAWLSNYNTNYNTNYNVVYPLGNRPVANQPLTGYNAPYYRYRGQNNWFSQEAGGNSPGYWGWAFYGQSEGCPLSEYQQYYWPASQQEYNVTYSCVGPYPGGANYTTNYNTNYNVVYPIANQPIANRPVANQPATTWSTNYNTIYPIANRPLANQPATTWSTNYNVAYPIANRPLANQPITGYTPGNVGLSTNVLGVTFPGGPIDTSGFPAGTPGTATPVGETAVSYNAYPDNASYPVTVPPGAQIVVKIE